MPATRPVNAESTADTDTKTAPTFSGTPFSIKYDKLVIAAGAYAQSKSKTRLIISCRSLTLQTAFNVPGVKEHAHFLKDVKDARKIRSRILECRRI